MTLKLLGNRTHKRSKRSLKRISGRYFTRLSICPLELVKTFVSDIEWVHECTKALFSFVSAGTSAFLRFISVIYCKILHCLLSYAFCGKISFTSSQVTQYSSSFSFDRRKEKKTDLTVREIWIFGRPPVCYEPVRKSKPGRSSVHKYTRKPGGTLCDPKFCADSGFEVRFDLTHRSSRVREPNWSKRPTLMSLCSGSVQEMEPKFGFAVTL